MRLDSVPVVASLAIAAQRLRVRHGDDVVAGIDEVDFAGHAGGEVGQQVERGAAELVEGDAAMQRRMPLLEGEHHARVADAGAGERADRPGGDGVNANLPRAEVD